MTTRIVLANGDTALAVEDRGAGEPVVLVQTALVADELAPLGRRLERAGHRVLRCCRRGYGGSGPASGPGSIARDAQDCAGLLASVGIARAHLVSVSYGAAVVLELAARRPDLVCTATVIEPPPTLLPEGADLTARAEFVAANRELLALYRSEGAAAALDSFLTRVVGADWRAETERSLPGSVAQMERDAATFFESDIPALLDWSFGPQKARMVQSPVLHVGGTDSGPWFAAVRRQVLEWFPAADDVLVEGADHNLALTHAGPVSEATARFLGRHPCRAH